MDPHPVGDRKLSKSKEKNAFPARQRLADSSFHRGSGDLARGGKPRRNRGTVEKKKKWVWIIPHGWTSTEKVLATDTKRGGGGQRLSLLSVKWGVVI